MDFFSFEHNIEHEENPLDELVKNLHLKNNMGSSKIFLKNFLLMKSKKAMKDSLGKRHMFSYLNFLLLLYIQDIDFLDKINIQRSNKMSFVVRQAHI